jgi:RES domain-containing protein
MSYKDKVATAILLYGDLENAFENLFFDEVESWFTADIACCGACSDDFCRRWPLIAKRDDNFQTSCIELSLFYEGSRLQEAYTQEQFDKYVKAVYCPSCNESLAVGGMIFAYNFPRYIPSKYGELFDEVGSLAAATPFLVLEHSFARSVLTEIRAAAETCDLRELRPDIWYRGRIAEHLRSRDARQFGPPDPAKTTEGRYNHAGKPVLYLGSDPLTCKLELGSPADGVVVAEFKFTKPLRVLDLSSEDLKGDVLPALVYSALLSSPDKGSGWDQPQYVFSRFVADCAVAAGFDAILYPSIRALRGDNLVVLRCDLIKTHLRFIKLSDLK